MSAASSSSGYFPLYPHPDHLPDPEIRTFITNFYQASDRPESNELWVSHFAKDAEVTIGADVARGEQEIRDLRQRIWTKVAARKHVVSKVFPGQFGEHGGNGATYGTEVMLYGEVHYELKDGQAASVPWAGHGVLKKQAEGEREEWKFTRYRVWLQK